MRDMDEKARGRQFWLRVFLVIGMLWGFLPFIMTPFITKGAYDTSFDILASILNSLTILPACALAFWHRHVACVWLSVNGALLAVALATFIRRTGKVDVVMTIEVAGPVLIALWLDYVEARHWPPAVNPRKVKAQLP
jgi:hypothetical protein